MSNFNGYYQNFIRATAFFDALSSTSRSQRETATASTMAPFGVVQSAPFQWLTGPSGVNAYRDAWARIMVEASSAAYGQGIRQPQGDTILVPVGEAADGAGYVSNSGYATISLGGPQAFIQEYVSFFSSHLAPRLAPYDDRPTRGDTGTRTFVAIYLAMFATLFYDMTERQAACITLYSPFNTLIPFASLADGS